MSEAEWTTRYTNRECKCDTDQAEDCTHYCVECGKPRYDVHTNDDGHPICFCCAYPMECL